MSMSTADRGTGRTWVRWSIPAVAAAGGIGYLVAGILGGQTGFGIFGLALMLVAGAAFVVASRWSETVAALMSRRDERINALDSAASLFAGLVVMLAALVMFMVSLARGDDGSPYAELCALGGVSYVAALVWLRFRR